MHNILKKLSIFFALFFSVANASAQEFAKANEPIYVVDMMRVFSESIPGKAASNNLQEEVKKKRVILEKKKVELDGLKQELDKQSSLLSESALQAKQEAFMKKNRDLERAYQDQKDEIAQKNKDAMEKVLKLINESIKEVSEKNKYRIVLEKDLRVVVYADKKYDISEEVIKQMNEKHVGL